MRNPSGVYGALLAITLTLFFSGFVQSSFAQSPPAWLTNSNTTGATQTPLSLGNQATPNTTIPSYQFNTTDGGTSTLEVHGLRYGSSFQLTRLDPNGTYNIMTIYGASAAGSGVSLFNQYNAIGLYLSAQGTTYFNGGGVCINCTNPGPYLLAVEGNVFANKVVVSLANPPADYVFYPDYPLPSLDSLSRYVTTHHHLPDVPSAATIVKNGLDLGENQNVLLKKIEELTLYIIGQSNEIQQLKKENAALEARNQTLEDLERRVKLLEDRAHH